RYSCRFEDGAVPSLALAQGSLGLLALGDILDHAEHAARPARLVPRHIAPTVDDAHDAVWPHHPILHVITGTATLRLRYCCGDPLTIFRVDEILMQRNRTHAGLRRQPKDASAFGRPDEAIGIEVTFPVTDVGHALGFFELALTFSKVA